MSGDCAMEGEGEREQVREENQQKEAYVPELSSTLPGLTSRCTTPCECSQSSAVAICMTWRISSVARSYVPLFTASPMDPALQYSITMKSCRSLITLTEASLIWSVFCVTPKKRTTWGWLIRESISASCQNSSSSSLPLDDLKSAFSTTLFPLYLPSHTSPHPPFAIFRTTVIRDGSMKLSCFRSRFFSSAPYSRSSADAAAPPAPPLSDDSVPPPPCAATALRNVVELRDEDKIC